MRIASTAHSYSSGPTVHHYRSPSVMSHRVSGANAAGGLSNTSLLGNSTSEYPVTEAGIGNSTTAHPLVPLAESPTGGDESVTTGTNGSTWGSNIFAEDGDVAPPTGGMHPLSADVPPFSTHRNINTIRRGSRFKYSPGPSVLQSPTIQSAASIGGFGSSSLSRASSTVPSGSSGASYTQRGKLARAHSVVVCGPAGIGKSSLILANQANWRSCGLWGYAKMVKGESSPFTGLVRRFFFF